MADLISAYAPKFSQVLDIVSADLATIRTGKANPQLVASLPVDAYGARMKLLELSTITAADPTTLIVTPFDVTNVDAVVKAITTANLGLTAIPEDTKIRVVIPPLSQERRSEYFRLAKTKVEGGKIMIRQVRHEAMEEISKSGANEDKQKHLEKETQTIVDKTTAQLDSLLNQKEKELLTL